MAALVVAATLVGYFGGSAVGDVLRSYPALHGWNQFPKPMAGFLLMSLAAGTVGTFYFVSREKLSRIKLEHQAALHQASQAQLALLQSQLEPQVAGGEIRVSAHADGNTLVLQVADTGVGFDTTVSAEGFGVTQVRDRLATRYGSHRYYKFHSCSSRYYGLKPLKCI